MVRQRHIKIPDKAEFRLLACVLARMLRLNSVTYGTKSIFHECKPLL